VRAEVGSGPKGDGPEPKNTTSSPTAGKDAECVQTTHGREPLDPYAYLLRWHGDNISDEEIADEDAWLLGLSDA
jgi:hypothetical protein